MTKNRALLVIIVVAVLVALGLAIFYFFFMREAAPYQPTTSDDTTFPIGPDLSGGTGATTTGSYEYQYYNQPKTYTTKERQRLRLISSLPVSGATLFERNAEVFVRYVERANGHIYEAVASRDEAPYRISKTTIPKIYEAYWVEDGQGVIIRYLKDKAIQTFYARIRSSASTSTEQDLVDGTFLPADIRALAVSPDSTRLFYLTDGGEGSLGFRANGNGTSRTQIWSSPAREWLPVWGGNNTLVLATKPSASVPGFAYSVNAGTGEMRRIIGGMQGLTVLPNNSLSSILYAESRGSGLTLKHYEPATGAVSDVGVNTLPEKCVWGRSGSSVIYCAVPDFISSASYPDAWYQGTVSFTDNLWQINLDTGETTILLSPPSVVQKTMDIVNPVLDEDGRYLTFINKKDLSLWLLDLSE